MMVMLIPLLRSNMAKEKFEDKMNRLKDIVSKIDDENTDLDLSIKLYEEGLKLADDLKKQLNVYEKQIEEISGDNKDE